MALAITVTPLTPVIGAEITGIDAANLSAEEFRDVFRAFTEHSVIFLKGQKALSAEEHRDFALGLETFMSILQLEERKPRFQAL